MNRQYILAIDQGTTGSKALIIDQSGEIIASHITDFPQIFPKSDWVEHNPEEIIKSVFLAIQAAIAKTNNPKAVKNNIACIGITNQRETTIAWDRLTGKPFYNAIVWQCKRTTEICNQLKADGHENIFRQSTGLLLDPYFSGTKMKWLLDNLNLRSQKNISLGTIDCYLLFKLTNGKTFATEASNASRTLLCNLEGKWDPSLLKILNIPINMLPEIKASNSIFGKTEGLDFLPDGIPITGILGDQQAALMGQTCFDEFEAKCTYGTGCFLMQNTGTKPFVSNHGLLTTIAWSIDNKVTYALEGSAFIAGAAVQWLRDGLGIIKDSKEIEPLALSVNSSEEVCFVPALSGLGSPYWQPDTKGLISGLTRASTKAHIARAALEGIAMQNYDIFMAMAKDTSHQTIQLSVDGGASKNDLLMQTQADLLQCKISRPKHLDTTALGAAYIAGLGAGIYKNLNELKNLKKIEKIFDPQKIPQKLINKWQKNIERLTRIL